MPLEDRIEKPIDPNAPKVFDLAKAHRLVALAPKYERLPGGEIVRECAEQLGFALAEIGGSSTKVVNAQNDAMRYQREAENANRDVQTANALLLKAREELEAAQREIVVLKAQLPKPASTPPAATVDAPPSVPKKTRRSAKVVPIEQAQPKAAT